MWSPAKIAFCPILCFIQSHASDGKPQTAHSPFTDCLMHTKLAGIVQKLAWSDWMAYTHQTVAPVVWGEPVRLDTKLFTRYQADAMST